jgi:hypothetical protein
MVNKIWGGATNNHLKKMSGSRLMYTKWPCFPAEQSKMKIVYEHFSWLKFHGII